MDDMLWRGTRDGKGKDREAGWVEIPQSCPRKKDVSHGVCKADVLFSDKPDPPQETALLRKKIQGILGWPQMENTAKAYLTRGFRELADQQFWDESHSVVCSFT